MCTETSVYRPVDFDNAVIISVDPLIGNHHIILGLFAKFQKGAISFIGARDGAVSRRHCATSQNVAGSIPDGVIGMFH